MPDGALPATADSITTGAKLRARRTGVIRIQPRTGHRASIRAGTGSPSRGCGTWMLAACSHLDPGAARGRLALASLLPGRGRLAAVCPRGGLVVTMAVTFWYAWLFNHTRGSILLLVIAHNIEGSIQYELGWIVMGVWLAVAIGLVVFDWKAGTDLRLRRGRGLCCR